jgi:hypothetical protein
MSPTRLLCFLRQLHERGPVNPYAVALILTECHFRGPLFRFCELTYAVVMLGFFKAPSKLTLGKCQVGLVYWQYVFGTRIWALVRATLDDICNYDVCCEYLRTHQCTGLKDTAIQYNGKPSYLYVRMLRNNLLIVAAAMERLNIDCNTALAACRSE